METAEWKKNNTPLYPKKDIHPKKKNGFFLNCYLNTKLAYTIYVIYLTYLNFLKYQIIIITRFFMLNI